MGMQPGHGQGDQSGTVQCPVCTLFLRQGMVLADHLDTHPKDQVIRALCSLATSSSAPEPEQTPSPSPSPSPSPRPSPQLRLPPAPLRYPMFAAGPTLSLSPLSPVSRCRPPRRSRQTDSGPFVPTPLALCTPPPSFGSDAYPRSLFVIAPSSPFVAPRAALPPPPHSYPSGMRVPVAISAGAYRSPSPYSHSRSPSSGSESFPSPMPIPIPEGRPRGLKIISNVKVELPLPDRAEVVDLTDEIRRRRIPERGGDSEETILPDLDSGSGSGERSCFSVIKNAAETRGDRMAPDLDAGANPPRSLSSTAVVFFGKSTLQATLRDPDADGDGDADEIDSKSEPFGGGDGDGDGDPLECGEGTRSSDGGVSVSAEAPKPERDLGDGDRSGSAADGNARDVDDDAVIPVKVIAFGGPDGSSLSSSSEAVLPETPLGSTGTETGRAESARPDDDYRSKFFPTENPFGAAMKDATEADARTAFPWDEVDAKDDFAFPSCAFRYPRLAERAPADVPPDDGNNEYAELVCPRREDAGDSRPETETDPLDALNIRTDERMPARGELSEQESSGDVDAAWAGMYCDVGMSSSYDRSPRDSAPPTPFGDASNEAEDVPIVTGVRPPERNYRCAACGMTFDCPKERRVHRSREHPVDDRPPTSAEKAIAPANIKRERFPDPSEPICAAPAVVKADDSQTRGGSRSSEAVVVGARREVKTDIDVAEGGIPAGAVAEEPKRAKKKNYSCGTCKRVFESDHQHRLHLKIHPLECLTCGRFFARRANLQLHLKRHLGIKNFKCELCEKRFITRQKMLEHYNGHTGLSPVKCTLCHETFRRYSNMVQHRNRHHLNLKKRLRDYVCQCGEVFHSKMKLAWHREIHEDKPKACPHCSEKFIHMASLTRHMRRAHNNMYIPDEKRKAENVPCPMCDKVYLKSSLEMHMKTHSGKKPYSCVICGKTFTTKWNLKLHRWTHANRSSKPFKCNQCKGAFIRHSDYVSHMNSHKSVRPYTCNYCGCQFIRKYNCQRHVKEHENEKKFVCQVPDCGKSFHRSYYLSEHMRVHSGARPFSCNICGKTSSTKSNHNKHVKIHHAREPVTTEG